jgi:hypothetical protein
MKQCHELHVVNDFDSFHQIGDPAYPTVYEQPIFKVDCSLSRM